MAKSKFNLEAVKAKIDQTKRELPKQLANLSQNYFVLSWKKQGFDGQKWQEVKRRIPGTPEYKYPSTKGLSRRTKPILVQSGELRRRVANSVVVANWNSILLVVDLPYAAAQNDGLNGLPQRQYMGQTKELEKLQIDKIEEYFNKVWK